MLIWLFIHRVQRGGFDPSELKLLEFQRHTVCWMGVWDRTTFMCSNCSELLSLLSSPLAIYLNFSQKLGVLACAFNPCTQEAGPDLCGGLGYPVTIILASKDCISKKSLSQRKKKGFSQNVTTLIFTIIRFETDP